MSGRIKYACSECGFEGRLWRQYNTFTDLIKLLCANCGMKPDTTWTGYLSAESCQLEGGELIPAIPTEDGETFWGYSSAPQELVVKWWGLPCSLLPDGWRLARFEEGNFSNPVGDGRIRTWVYGGKFKITQWDSEFFVCRLGVEYNGQSVSSIPELLAFLVANDGEVDVTPRRDR